MNEYKVTGKYHTWDDESVTTTHRVCRIIAAKSLIDALIEADSGLPVDARWVDDDPTATETLASLERRALADWNAQRPTASPLALAHARGEL